MGYKIKEMRKRRGMTQEQLSVASGVSRPYLSLLESGKIESTKTETLVKLAKALNCKISDIFFTGKV